MMLRTRKNTVRKVSRSLAISTELGYHQQCQRDT
jgi:hypothetical protein